MTSVNRTHALKLNDESVRPSLFYQRKRQGAAGAWLNAGEVETEP